MEAPNNDATVAALKALIDSAGLSEEQRRAIGLKINPKSTYKPIGPRAHVSAGDWVQVKFPDGETMRMYVYRATGRSLKLHKTDTAYARRVKAGVLPPKAFQYVKGSPMKDGT